VTESREMKLAGHRVHVGAVRNVCNILV